MEIDVRITIDDEPFAIIGESGAEHMLIHNIVADVSHVRSAVVLRNDGWSHLLPDESTRQER